VSIGVQYVFESTHCRLSQAVAVAGMCGVVGRVVQTGTGVGDGVATPGLLNTAGPLGAEACWAHGRLTAVVSSHCCTGLREDGGQMLPLKNKIRNAI
jgi:hypothetical protein